MASSSSRLFRAFVDTVPHWYVADYGPYNTKIRIHNNSYHFKSLRNLTPDLFKYKEKCEQLFHNDFIDHLIEYPSFEDLLQEGMALAWLNLRAPNANWMRIVKYCEEITNRTYENSPVGINVIVRPGATGGAGLDDRRFAKFTDHLASDLFTYFLVDEDLRVLDYLAVEWRAITSPGSYSLYPELLHPFQCVMRDGDYSFHLTKQRDLLIAEKHSLLAARRKKKWKIYDTATFRNQINDVLGNFALAANVFEVLFDLSLRRHGALLVYDPEARLRRHIINPESHLDGDFTSGGRELIAAAAARINLCRAGERIQHKRLLLELAGVDGAVVFDDHRIRAVGALIATHPDAEGRAGARSTAALSAYLYGGRPAKVSADGEIGILFESSDPGGRCRAELEWL